MQRHYTARVALNAAVKKGLNGIHPLLQHNQGCCYAIALKVMLLCILPFAKSCPKKNKQQFTLTQVINYYYAPPGCLFVSLREQKNLPGMIVAYIVYGCLCSSEMCVIGPLASRAIRYKRGFEF